MHKQIQGLTFIHGLYRYNIIMLSSLFVNTICQNLILKNVSTNSFNAVYKHRTI